MLEEKNLIKDPKSAHKGYLPGVFTSGPGWCVWCRETSRTHGRMIPRIAWLSLRESSCQPSSPQECLLVRMHEMWHSPSPGPFSGIYPQISILNFVNSSLILPSESPTKPLNGYHSRIGVSSSPRKGHSDRKRLVFPLPGTCGWQPWALQSHQPVSPLPTQFFSQQVTDRISWRVA